MGLEPEKKKGMKNMKKKNFKEDWLTKSANCIDCVADAVSDDKSQSLIIASTFFGGLVGTLASTGFVIGREAKKRKRRRDLEDNYDD